MQVVAHKERRRVKIDVLQDVGVNIKFKSPHSSCHVLPLPFDDGR